MNNDTIAAIATGMSAGGIGIIRISGNAAVDILAEIFRCGRDVKTLNSHMFTYGHIVSENGVIDEVLAVIMSEPRSYTKETVVEINCHGGIKCVQAVLAEVLKNGARLAEPGEFTKRAFLNGRIDLSRAEAVMDIITAKTDNSRKAAAVRLEGGLYKIIYEMRERILTMLAHIEASIDYPEHELEQMNLEQVYNECATLVPEIIKLAGSADRGRILREGLSVVILGKPNVGKSSLLNALLNEDRAIVTEIAGTTRDIIQEYIDIGIPLKITDTAGIRETVDEIEKIGVKKSIKAAESADLILLVLDGSMALDEKDIELLEFIKSKPSIIILNKSDLPACVTVKELREYSNVISFSIVKNQGFEQLYEIIKAMFFGEKFNINDEVIISGLRQKNALFAAAESLKAVMLTVENGFTEDLASMDLSGAYYSLGEITGESLAEDLIDKIFSEFCLGK